MYAHSFTNHSYKGTGCSYKLTPMHRRFSLLLSCLVLILSACGGSHKDPDAATGSISFSLRAPVAQSAAANAFPLIQAAAISCDEYGVTDVEAYVYDENNVLIAQGGPWPCLFGEGIISGVKPGTNRSVRVNLRDSAGALVLTGSKSDITVIGGQMADVGSIELISQEEVIEAIVYVRPDGADGNNGSTWDQAVQTIQKAVDLANPGDEIWVAEGDYAISTTIEIAKPVKIYGGFAGDETTRDERHGEGDAIVSAFFPDRCFHITANAIIDRMTITSDADYTGGGIRSEGTSAQDISVTLRSCVIQGNTSDQGGGGISNAYGTIAISRCQLYNNTGRYGGAISSFYSTVSIADSEFGSNTTTGEDNGYGGAVYSYECPAVDITRGIFTANQGIWGGGVANFRSSVTLTSCVFNDNEARNTYGGGVCTLLGDVTITNCTFVGNSALEGGGAISNLDLDTSPGSSARITNCILWSDSSPEIHNRSSTPIVNYCDVQGGYLGDTNINSDPVLIKNVFLDPSSPCIDAGTNAAPSLPEFDLFGNPRIDIVGLIVDMGAAEYVYP